MAFDAPISDQLMGVGGRFRQGGGDRRSRPSAPVHVFRFDTDQCAFLRQVATQPQRVHQVGQSDLVHAAVLVPEVSVHCFALEHGDSAGAESKFHRIESDESVEIGEPVQQREAYGTAIKTKHVVIRVAFGKSLECVDTGSVIREKTVTDAYDSDRFRSCGHFWIPLISKD